MTISQRQLVQECFDGERERTCNYCPAHYTKNGICCFGQKFEYGDPQCVSCPHVPFCEPAMEQFLATQQQQSRPQRIMVNGGAQPASQPARGLPVYGQARPAQSGAPVLMQKATIAKPIESYNDMGFWQQMGLTAAWGAVEGALELLLGFFRTRRPD
jgi:hypothetical protein